MNQEGGNILKLLTGNIGGIVKGKSKQATRAAVQGAVNALPVREVKHLTKQYSDAALQGALITLSDALKNGRRAKKQKGAGRMTDKISRVLKRAKAKAVYYKPTNVVRRGTKSLTDAALDGVFDSALERVQSMQNGRGLAGEIIGGIASQVAGLGVKAAAAVAGKALRRKAANSKPARGVSSAAAFSRRHRAKLNKGLDMLEKFGSKIDGWQKGGSTFVGSRGTVLTTSRIAVPWVFKTVDPTMSGVVLNNALNRLSTKDRIIAIEMLKKGHKY